MLSDIDSLYAINPNLKQAKHKPTLYHGITPRGNTFQGDEMPKPSSMISPKKYVDLLESILNDGLKGFHKVTHPLYLNEEHPTIYLTTQASMTYGHLGIVINEFEKTTFSTNSFHEVVLFGKMFKSENFMPIIKTFDYAEANYDGGRSSFSNLSQRERKILKEHINQTWNELERRGIEFQILDLNENGLIDIDEYEEKNYS